MKTILLKYFLYSICIVLVCLIPFSGTLSYSVVSIDHISSSMLHLQNGKISLNVDYSRAIWKDSMGKEITEVTDPIDNAVIEYGPIYIDASDMNIISNMLISVSYNLESSVESKISDVAKVQFCLKDTSTGIVSNFGYNNFSFLSSGNTIYELSYKLSLYDRFKINDTLSAFQINFNSAAFEVTALQENYI